MDDGENNKIYSQQNTIISDNSTLFSKIKYYLSGNVQEQVKKILKSYGAEGTSYFSDYVTHCILGDNYLENDVTDAKDLYEVPAVTEQWVLYSAYCNTLLPTNAFVISDQRSLIGVSACLSQISKSDCATLWALITYNGGYCDLLLRRNTTHLVITNLKGRKYEYVATGKTNIKVVTPDWVTHCIRSQCVCDESLYHPSLLIGSPDSGEKENSIAVDTSFDDNYCRSELSKESVNRSEQPNNLQLEQSMQKLNRQTIPVSVNVSTMSHTAIQQDDPSKSDIYANEGKPLDVPYLDEQKQITNEPCLQSTSTALQQLLPNEKDELPSHDQLINDSAQPGSLMSSITPTQLQQKQQMMHRSQLIQQQSAFLLQKRALAQQQRPQQLQQRVLLQQQLLQQSNNGTQWRQSPTNMVQEPNVNQLLQTSPPSQAIWQQQQQVQFSPSNQLQPSSDVWQQQQMQHIQQPPPQIQLPNNQIVQTSPNNQMLWQQQQQQQQQQPQLLQMRQNERQNLQMNTWVQQQPNQQQPQIQQQQHQLQQQQHPQLQQQQPQPAGAEEMIQMDAKTHQHLQQMTNSERIVFINKLKLQKLYQMQQQQRQMGQNVQQQTTSGGTVIRTITPQMIPPGLSQQQQIQWLQQHHQQLRQQQLLAQQQQQVLTRSPTIVKGNLSMAQRLPAQQTTWQQRPELDQIVQMQQQRHMQQRQQIQLQQMAPNGQIITGQQVVMNVGPTQPANSLLPQQQQQQQQPPSQPSTPSVEMDPSTNQDIYRNNTSQAFVVNSKTKTALANMLSVRLQAGQEVSAAGQLRMMTAQHQAGQRASPATPASPVATQAQFQRTVLNNVTNSSPNAAGGATLSRGSRAVAAAVHQVKSQAATRVAAALAKCAAGQVATQAAAPQTRYFGHSSNIQIPPDKCLLGCVFLILEYDKHADFSSQVAKWHTVIEENGGEVELQYSLRLTHIICQTQRHPLVQQGIRDGKRCVTADWLSDILIKQQLMPPYYALHFPVPFSDERPCRQFMMSLTGFQGEERNRVKYMIELTGAKCTSYFSSDNNFLICRRLEGRKVRKARDLGKAVVNVQWLSDILLGNFQCIYQTEIPKFQHYGPGNPFKIDYMLVMHLMVAWKMPINVTQELHEKALSTPSRKRKRFKSNPSTAVMDSDQENSEALLNSELSTNVKTLPPGSRPKILLSGFVNPIAEKKMIKELGGEIANSPRDATHLVMMQPNRTFKFLCCISTCKFIVHVAWLKNSHASNTFLDESSYTVEEVKVDGGSVKCDVRRLLKYPNRNELFKGKIFYITPAVVPSPSALKEIIECAGGCVEKQRRSLKNIQDMKPMTYLPITCSGDLHLVADLIQSDCGAYNAEFVLSAVMTQEIQYDIVFKKQRPLLMGLSSFS